MVDFQENICVMKKISVIIPTFNRLSTLLEVLDSLNRQDYKNFEVIVVSDGSTESGYEKVMDNKYNFLFSYIAQKNGGPASARNTGLRNISKDSELILFIGDDMLTAENLLSEHVSYHELFSQINIAILGMTFWHNSVKDRFVDFLAPRGPQFNYSGLKDKSECNFQYLHTSNISFKREMLDGIYFDEDFKLAAMEDTELGYRLERDRNLKIIFNPRAVTYHKHKYTRQEFKNRQKNLAPWIWLSIKKHPKLINIVIKKKTKILYYLIIFCIAWPLYLIKNIFPKKFSNKIYRVYNLMYFELLMHWHIIKFKLK